MIRRWLRARRVRITDEQLNQRVREWRRRSVISFADYPWERRDMAFTWHPGDPIL